MNGQIGAHEKKGYTHSRRHSFLYFDALTLAIYVVSMAFGVILVKVFERLNKNFLAF